MSDEAQTSAAASDTTAYYVSGFKGGIAHGDYVWTAVAVAATGQAGARLAYQAAGAADGAVWTLESGEMTDGRLVTVTAVTEVESGQQYDPDNGFAAWPD